MLATQKNQSRAPVMVPFLESSLKREKIFIHDDIDMKDRESQIKNILLFMESEGSQVTHGMPLLVV